MRAYAYKPWLEKNWGKTREELVNQKHIGLWSIWNMVIWFVGFYPEKISSHTTLVGKKKFRVFFLCFDCFLFLKRISSSENFVSKQF